MEPETLTVIIIGAFSSKVSVRSSIFNHFNKERHLNSRDTFKVQREAALVEWQQLFVV